MSSKALSPRVKAHSLKVPGRQSSSSSPRTKKNKKKNSSNGSVSSRSNLGNHSIVDSDYEDNDSLMQPSYASVSINSFPPTNSPYAHTMNVSR